MRPTHELDQFQPGRTRVLTTHVPTVRGIRVFDDGDVLERVCQALLPLCEVSNKSGESVDWMAWLIELTPSLCSSADANISSIVAHGGLAAIVDGMRAHSGEAEGRVDWYELVTRHLCMWPRIRCRQHEGPGGRAAPPEEDGDQRMRGPHGGGHRTACQTLTTVGRRRREKLRAE